MPTCQRHPTPLCRSRRLATHGRGGKPSRILPARHLSSISSHHSNKGHWGSFQRHFDIRRQNSYNLCRGGNPDPHGNALVKTGPVERHH